MRSPGPFPRKAILLFAGVVLALRLAAMHPFRSPLLAPGLLGAALFLYAPFLHYRKGRSPSWTGVGNLKRNAVLFLSLGAGGALAFLLVSSLPFSPIPEAETTLLGPFVLRQALLVALPEEVFFRGYLYDAFEETGREPILPSSLLFAAGHLITQASAYRALTFFPGLLLGYARKKSGNIHVPVLLHLLFNLFPHLLGG